MTIDRPAQRAPSASRRAPRALRGVSLIQVMIGLTIGMFLTLALLALINNTSRSFNVQDDFARMQENGIAALRYIGDDIRMAGFYGSGFPASAANITAAGGATTTGDCGSTANPPAANWALAAEVPLIGFGGLTPATVNATLPCILGTNFTTGQILALRLATGVRVPDPNNDGDLSDIVLEPTTLYVQTNPGAGIIFRGASFAGLRAAGLTRRLTGGADAPVFEYQARVYYTRPCSRPATPPACQPTDDGGLPIPTLVRQELAGNTMVERALVEGIEMVTYIYGLDTANQDGIPDVFTATPAAAQWNQVVTVRVAVLVRNTRPTPGHNDAGKLYDLNGDGVPDFTCIPGPNCSFKRHVFSQSFQVRNVAQRRGA
jgi:type IV pilus assembly protein PilW